MDRFAITQGIAIGCIDGAIVDTAPTYGECLAAVEEHLDQDDDTCDIIEITAHNPDGSVKRYRSISRVYWFADPTEER